MKEIIFEVLNEMSDSLSVAQLKKLQEVLINKFSEANVKTKPAENAEYLEMFIHAKKVEGLSERTLKYYRATVEHMLAHIETPIRKITTDQIRTNQP